MPFAPKYKSQDEQNKDMNISGSSSIINVPGGGGSAAPGAQKSSTSSGQYQNLQKYLNANQSQGAEMGQKVAQDVENQVGQAQNKVNSTIGKVENTQSYDPNEAINKVNAGQSLSDDDKKKYQSIKSTGGYTGPSSFAEVQGYGDAKTVSDQAKEKVGLAGNELGQQSLLKQSYARPSYSRGENILDQSLVMGSNQGKQAISSLADKYKDLSGMFDNQFNSAQNQINQNVSTASANKAKFNPAESQAMTGLMNNLNEKAKSTNENNSNIQNQLQNSIAYGNYSPEALKALGLNAGDRLWDLNLNKYMTYDQTPMTANTVATQDDRNKYKLLNDLFGTQGNEITDVNPLENYKPYNFNKDQFAFEQAGRAKSYNDLMNTQSGQVLSTSALTNSGLGLRDDVVNALSNMSISQMENWINSLPDVSHGYGSGKSSSTIQNLLSQIQNIKNQYGVNNFLNMKNVLPDQNTGAGNSKLPIGTGGNGWIL